MEIEAKSISKAFPGKQSLRPALQHVSFQIGHGEFIALVGISGCGKTTLLRILGGLERADSGQILLDGKSPNEKRRDGVIGYLFQEHSLFPWRNAHRNVSLPTEISGHGTSDDATNLISRVDLQGSEELMPDQLSGGMKQRIALARALVTRPDLLLLDEPFGSLDAITRFKMNELLLELWITCDPRPTTVLITHSVPEAAYLADRTFLFRGKQPGTIADAIDHPFPRPRKSSLRRDPTFRQHCDKVEDLLNGYTLDSIRGLSES